MPVPPSGLTPSECLASVKHMLLYRLGALVCLTVQRMCVLLWVAGWLATAHAGSTAWVSGVMDGDTVLLVSEGGHEPIKLRLVGMDAPESCQPGGQDSRNALIDRVLHRVVQVRRHGADSYGRSLGQLWLDGEDVGAAMVRSGWAWAYSYRVGRGPYAALQREAQRERRGVFAAREAAMPPSVFRQFHGSCHEPTQAQTPVQRLPQTGQARSR